jgi:hypothetical protein
MKDSKFFNFLKGVYYFTAPYAIAFWNFAKENKVNAAISFGIGFVAGVILS